MGVLSSLLAAVWDFDSDIATTKLDPAKIFGKPIRAYYQRNALPAGAAPGSVLIESNAARWRTYVERGAADPKEVPPLPPDRTNSNTDPAKDGHDSPHRSPPTPPGFMYTHHLVRDFMFLDAAASNEERSGNPNVTPLVPQQFTVRFRPLDPTEDPGLAEFTRGTGRQQVTQKHLIDDTTVSGSGDLAYLHQDVSFSTLLYELVDLQGNNVDGSRFSPNWFGVAVPDGITDFTSVVIYFHPTPEQAGYVDSDYPSKSNGGNSTHSDWKDLLGYVDRVGSQLAGAVEVAGATPNQVVIVPIMRTANVDGGSPTAGGAGILPRQWYHVVNEILKDLQTRLASL
jgi:hypothetical protein